MDDTQASLKQSDGANTTRKRRSSILKSQRPPRTPFSEVELYVATPTDTAKNRRVSFSRRTGVAEFITNEATTTWKNFYEEHNKSLESSGNESAANAPRQTIEHIGKRIFDQQFEEVEAVDFGGTLHANPLQEFQASFNNMNFTQQLASLECMKEDGKPIVSNSNFELSALTEHSKPFGNEISVPVMEDMTNQMSMNFSVMQPVGASTNCDDLDEIQKDLKRTKPNVLCPGPLGAERDFSEYIEVDLNMTHVAIHQDESEMSITDTIKSPKVQEVKKSNILNKKEKSFNKDVDWNNDKENIAINPYVAPKESVNFAINKSSDKVLVFDGKRLTTQSITSKVEQVESNDVNFRQTLLSSNTAVIPQRKTITLNINDDLPNFIENNYPGSTTKPINEQDEFKSTTMFNEINMSITNVINNHILEPASNTIQFDNEGEGHRLNDAGNNISFTQVLPSNIIDDVREYPKMNSIGLNNKSRNKTILYEDIAGDISITQALPNKIIHLHENKEKTVLSSIDDMDITREMADRLIHSKSSTEKRKTIIFDSNTNDISMTQVLPTNINYIIKEDEYNHRPSSQYNANTSNEEILNTEKQKTIFFDNNTCDISMTQALPTNININKKNIDLMQTKLDKSSTGIEHDKADNNRLLNTGKRKTIIFDCDSGDLSMTQALPTNFDFIKSNESFIKKTMGSSDTAQLIETKEPEDAIGAEKRKTIIYNDESCNISITQVIPTNINFIKHDSDLNRSDINQSKGKYPTLTESEIPNVISHCTEKYKTVLFDDESSNVSITQTIPSNIYFNEDKNSVPETNSYKNVSNINLINNSAPDLKQNVLSHEIVVDANDGTFVSTKIKNTVINEIEVGNNGKINIRENTLINTNKPKIEVQVETTKIENPEIIKRQTFFDSHIADISIATTLSETLLQNMVNSGLGNGLENHNVKNISDDVKSAFQDPIDFTDLDNNQTLSRDLPKNKSTNISMTKQIPTDMANIHEKYVHNVSNIKENDNFNVQSLNMNKSILIYQVNTNEHVDQRNKDDVIDKWGKAILSDESMSDDIIKHSICNESPIEFSIDDNEQSHSDSQEEQQEVPYKTYDGALLVRERVECLQPPEVGNKTKPKKSILNELLNMSCESIEDKTEDGPNNKLEHLICNSGDITKDGTGIETLLEDIGNCSKDIDDENISGTDRSPIQDDINYVTDKNQTLFHNINKSINISMNKQISTEFVSNLNENDKIQPLNMNKSTLIYQVKNNEHVKQGNEDDIIIDKSGYNILPNESTYGEIINKSGKEKSINSESHNISQEEKLEFSYSILDVKENSEQLQSPQDEKIPKKSILNELLNMSCESIGDKMEEAPSDKLEHFISSSGDINTYSTEIEKEVQESNSKESFLIIKSDSDIKLDNETMNFKENADCDKTVESGLYLNDDQVQLSVEISKSNTHKDFDMKNSNFNELNIEKENEHGKLINVKTITDEIKNDKFLLKVNSNNNETNNFCEKSTSFRDADNTKELLEMLSDFTDEGKDGTIEGVKNNSDIEKISPVGVKGNIDLAHKSIIQEPKCLSFASRRQSVVITREDLLNNISMAQAGLLQSRFESEDSESMDDTVESITQEQDQSRKSNRLSNEVVKTLQFEDESISDSSVRSEVKTSPLMKKAYGESFVHENKAKVIPQYLNVTDNIKDLMHDLVKPTSDLPFDRVLDKNDLSSSCSTQLQTNLTTPSQIDIKEFHSNPDLVCNLKEDKFLISDVIVIDSMSPTNRDMQDSIKGEKVSTKLTHEKAPIPKVLSPKATNKRVIIFDHQNPLNNILLPSTDFADTHNYKPLDNIQKPTEEKQEHITKYKENKLRQPVQCNQETNMIKETNLQTAETVCEKNVQTINSDTRSMDKSIDGIATDLKDMNVNTLIVMKGNKELLDQSSSLTLADDALAENEFELNTKHISECKISKNSVVKFLYKKESVSELEKDSDMNCDEELFTDIEMKPRKRSYSPTKHKSLSNIEVTPKPMSKIQKMTNSAVIKTTLNNSDRTEVNNINETHEHIEPSEIKNATENNTLNIKQFETHIIKHDIDKSNMPQINVLTLAKTEVMSLNNLSSVASDIKDASVTTSEERSSVASKVSSLDWQPESSSETNSKEQIESGANVVTKINILPFMGVECEWERPGPTDSWVFRLLRDRLRVRVRLGHAQHATLRTCVRADTPIVDANVDVLHTDEKDNLIAVCVHLAAEAMRYEWSRMCGVGGAAEGGASAEAVPVFLRRCVAVARLALRWARVMRDARARLAYDITRDGHITLKVANFPLRCVWEVRMRVSLVAGEGRSGAWPRSDDVHAMAVLAADTPAPAVLQRLADAQPCNWGHAPRTLWKVFKYLKNRTQQEEALLGL